MGILSGWGSWRDNLSDAAFRGKPFKVLSTETTIGRRIRSNITATQNVQTTNKAARARRIAQVGNINALEEFTGNYGGYQNNVNNTRVVRYIENVEQIAHLVTDMGREPEKFTITGYVIQNSDNNYDYFKERDDLMVALNTWGPGILSHPFYGELSVHVAEPVKITESFAEGGIARFQMTFVEHGDLNLENLMPSYAWRITSLSQLLNELGLDALADAIEGVQNAIALAGAVREGLEKVQQGINSVRGAITSTIAAATGLISSIISSIDSILDAPCEIFNALKSGAGAFKALVGMAGDAIGSETELLTGGTVGRCSGKTRSDKQVYVLNGETVPEELGVATVEAIADITDYSSSDFGETTSSDGTTAQTIVSNAVKFFVFIVAVEISVKIQFTNKDRMLGLLEKLVDRMDAFLDELGAQDESAHNDDLFTGMSALRNEYVSAMHGLSTNVTQLSTYTVPPDGPPLLVIAYNLYEDIYQDQTIIDLNPLIVQHPGFPPPLSVLSVPEY